MILIEDLGGAGEQKNDVNTGEVYVETSGGMPIEEIARFLGHSSLDSTQIYTHLTNNLNHKLDMRSKRT